MFFSYTQSGYVYAITAIDPYGNESQPYIKTPSGVQSGIVDSLVVYGGSGAIYVSVPKDMDIYIYSLQAVDSYGQSFGWKFRNNGSSRNVYY